MTQKSKGNRFLNGVLLVTVATFIGKVLSALYRVPYQNMTGDLGYYVYQQVYPFYGAAMVVSLYGFPVVIAKMVTEAELKNGDKEALETALASFVLLSIFHFVLFFVLFFSAPIIANWMGDVKLTTPLQIISVVFLFVPFFSSMRGFFQGIGDMHSTAVSHLTEQFVRVACILSFAAFVVYAGKDAYAAGIGAALGSILGSGAGVLYLSYRVFRSRPSFVSLSFQRVKNRVREMTTTLFVQGFLIAMTSMMFILYQMVDAFTLPRLLQASGLGALDAKELKGVFDRGQPLLQFGTVIASTFAMVIVPLIHREITENNVARSRYFGGLAVRVALLIGAAAAIGLCLIAEPVNMMLFENKEGTIFIRILAFSLIASGVITTTSAVMQGHNDFVRPAFFLLLGLLVKAVGNTLFIPLSGGVGAAIATVIGFVVTAGSNVYVIYHKNWMDFPPLRWLWKMGKALFFMGIFVYGLLTLLEWIVPDGRVGATIISLVVASIGAWMFLQFTIQFSLFTKEERVRLPLLSQMERYIRRKES